MYRDNLYNQDMFHQYKMALVEVLEKANENVDEDYYEKVGEELYFEIGQIMDELNKIEIQQLYELEGLSVVPENEINTFQERAAIEERVADYKQQKAQKEKEHIERENKILEKSGGMGYNTRTLLENLMEDYAVEIAELDEKIEKEEENYININREDMERYFRIKNELEEIKDGKYKNASDRVRYLLKKIF